MEWLNGPAWEDLALSAGILLAVLLAAAALYLTLFWALGRVARKAAPPLALLLVERLRQPARLLIPLLALTLAAPSLPVSAAALLVIQHLLSLCIIAGFTWLVISATRAGRDHLVQRYAAEAQDDFRARAVQTQLTLAVKVVVVIVLVVALSAMLMTFARIRTVGMSILASAGIVGITVGFAAQRSIATLFAGLQIAITQPIRIRDVVLVEGEYGVIEDITLSYVVVRIWDMRRLVVPVTYFLEKPFQNWTRSSTNLLATVYLYADYGIAVEPLRRKLHEILKGSPKWDGEVWGLQVTGATDRSLELRALMSAVDSSASWDLRCEVREKLLRFLQESCPDSLPRVRAELSRAGTSAQAAGGGVPPR